MDVGWLVILLLVDTLCVRKSALSEFYNLRCSVSIGHACSSTFWKKMEYIFSSVSSEETSYLEQQVVPTICFCNFDVLYCLFVLFFNFFLSV